MGVSLFFVASAPSDKHSVAYAFALVREVSLFVGVVKVQGGPSRPRTRMGGRGSCLSLAKEVFPPCKYKSGIRWYRQKTTSTIPIHSQLYDESFVEFAWADNFARSLFLPGCY